MTVPSSGDQPPGAWSTPEGDPEPLVHWAPPVPASVPGVPGLVFASTGSRAVAYTVDGVILIVLGLVIGLLLSSITGESVFGQAWEPTATEWDPGSSPFDIPPQPITATIVLYTMAGGFISLAYHVWSWRSRARATPGQRLFGIQVGDAAGGRRLTTRQAIIRWAALGNVLLVLSFAPTLATIQVPLVLLWSLLLLLSTAVESDHRGLHDRIAGTAVVQPAHRAMGAATAGCAIILLFVGIIVVFSIVGIAAMGDEWQRMIEEASRQT